MQTAKVLYVGKQYKEALKEYSELIGKVYSFSKKSLSWFFFFFFMTLWISKTDVFLELYPTAPLHYANRAACYMMLDKYLPALEDAKKCIELDAKVCKVR